MELLGQPAQEPRARRGPIGCPIVVGAKSPIRAGRGDFSFLRVQGPLYAGMPALRGADAGTSAMAASELVDHAAGRCTAGLAQLSLSFMVKVWVLLAGSTV